MKKVRKATSIMMAAIFCLASVNGHALGTAKAADDGQFVAIRESLQMVRKKAIATQHVQFGSYWQEDTNGDGKADQSDAKTPMKWRVLWTSDTQACLLSEYCIDAGAFHNTGEKVTWETCDLRKWLNGTWINDAFNAKERAAILEKEYVTEGDSFTENKSDIATRDRVCLPSIGDMTNGAYQFDINSNAADAKRTATNTAYCASKEDRYGVGEKDTYWLRNSGQFNDQACSVSVGGIIEYLTNVDYQGHGIRPMLYLNLGAEKAWTETGDPLPTPGCPNQTDSPGKTATPGQTTAPSQAPLGNAGTAEKSNNVHQNEYPYYASQTVASHLASISGELYERAEYTGDKIVIETYDKETFRKQSSKELAMELPIYGGIYLGEKYHFIVFGQENLEENDSAEVIRICKYDKNWNRLGSGSVYGANTIRPFRAGSLRMCESGGMLYIRTCHQMYTSDDGLNHQANMTIAFRQSDATVTDCFSKVWNMNTAGYASHSFNQFIKTHGKDIIAVDHGDAYPRAFLLTKFSGNAGGESVTVSTTPLELNKFAGASGENYTGAELGGLEISSSHYLIAANSVDQEADYSGKVRNIYLYAVDQSNFSSDGIKTKKITNYGTNGSVSASVPYIAKLEQNRFILVWEEIAPYPSGAFYPKINCSKTLKYALVDGQGNVQGEVKSISGCLSDCEPLVENGVLTWFVTEDSAPAFYQLDVSKGTVEKYDALVGSALPGDVLQDGKIDGKDVSMLLQYRLGKRELTAEQIAAGDVYQDGKIDGKDVSKLLQYRLGKISSLE